MAKCSPVCLSGAIAISADCTGRAVVQAFSAAALLRLVQSRAIARGNDPLMTQETP